MAELKVVQATMAHARALGVSMRDADAKEVWAMSRKLPVEAVENSINLSLRSWAVEVGDDVPVVFGIAPFSFVSSVAAPWALTGDSLHKHALSCQRAVRPILGWMLAEHRVLANAIHADNALALRWAEAVGFQVASEPLPLGAAGELFYPIMMRT